MSDTPRQNAQAGRLARRQSPYTRPAAPPTPAPSTPSRLRSLLAYVSPFRSARKASPPPPPVARDETPDEEIMVDDGEVEDDEGEPTASRSLFANHRQPLASSSRTLSAFGSGTTSSAPATPNHHAWQPASREELPTAFTPRFRPEPAALWSEQPAPQPTAADPAAAPQAKRRRPVYVGAGYTARRRRQPRQPLEGGADDGEAATPAGKRRRVVESPADARAVGTLSFARASPAGTPGRPPSTSVSSSSQAPTSRSTTAAAASPAQAEPSPRRAPTRAADLMLDIIHRGGDASGPSRRTTTTTAADPARILNPYDTEEDPLKLVSARPAAAQSAGEKDDKIAAPTTTAPTAAPAPKPLAKVPAPSALETLQRTMPAEYRRGSLQPQQKSQAQAPPAAAGPSIQARAQPPAQKAPVKQPATIEILSSSEEEEEASATEMVTSDHDTAEQDEEEEEEEDEEGDEGEEPEEEEEEAEIMVVESDADETGTDSDAPTEASKIAAAPAPPTFSFAPAPQKQPSPVAAPPAPVSTPPAAAPPVVAPVAQSLSEAAPAKGPVETLPANATADTPAAAVPDDARQTARDLPRAQLPLASFSFTGVAFGRASPPVTEIGLEAKAVAEIARNLGRGELPTFAF
ncbi:hypothetical protein JCM8202v2_003931 [Rhodotorula sphaerocarpa]